MAGFSKMVLIAVLTTGLGLTTAIQAAPFSAPEPAAAPAPPAAPPAVKPRVTCKVTQVTGSLIKKVRVCGTADEWAQRNAVTREELNKMANGRLEDTR